MNNLNERQRKILEFISNYIDEKGYSPSVREIAEATGVKSTRGVTINLDSLERAGYLQRDPYARSIRLTNHKEPEGYKMLPLMGTIAAGSPVLAQEYIESVIPVPDILVPDAEGTIVLRVKGESMIGEGIHDGDMIIVRRQPVVNNGELAAVIIDGEATVKRFYRDAEDTVRLEPSNPAYEPIIISLKDSQAIIAGKVIGLLRSYR